MNANAVVEEHVRWGREAVFQTTFLLWTVHAVVRSLENDFLENDFPTLQGSVRATRQGYLPLERGASS